MLQNADQIKPDQKVGSGAARTLAKVMHYFLGGIGAFTTTPELHDCFETRAIAGTLRVQAWVVIRPDHDQGSHFRGGLTQDLVGTLIDMRLPAVGARAMGGAFDRTVVEEAMLRPGVAPHGQASRAQGHTLGVHPLSGAGGSGMEATAGIESDHRADVLRREEGIHPQRIMARIIAHGIKGDGEVVCSAGFSKARQALEGEGKIGLRGRANQGMHGEIVAATGDTMLIVSMAEIVGVPIGVVAPIDGEILIHAVARTAKDALRPAGTGRSAVGTGAGHEGRAIATDEEVVERAKQPPLGGREDGGLHEEIFQACQEIGRARLRRRGEELGLEMGGEGVTLGEDGLAGSLFGGVFLGEIVHAAPFAGGRRADGMGTGRLERAIVEPINEEREGADGRGGAGREPGDVGEARLAAEVGSKGIETVVAEQGEQEQGAEHRKGVVGGRPRGEEA